MKQLESVRKKIAKILLQTLSADHYKCAHPTGKARMAELVDALD
jgi:hypothetical protein